MKYPKSIKISGLNHLSQSFILLINVKMPTIVGILTFMSRINFMLSSVEHEKSLITSGPGLTAGSKFCENSLKDDRVSPSCRSGCLQFNSTPRMACVAHALFITYRKKQYVDTPMNIKYCCKMALFR